VTVRDLNCLARRKNVKAHFQKGGERIKKNKNELMRDLAPHFQNSKEVVYLNPKPETQYPKPETRKPKTETRNPIPETRNPKPETRNPKP